MLEEDLVRLVEARTPERIDLEFKSASYGRDDSSKREFLKDVSALANTRGGLLLIGIEETDGFAAGLVPLASAVADVERQRLEQLVQAGIEPRLFGVTFDPIQVGDGIVLAIHVRRSASAPHRVIANGVNRFYLRSSTNVYEASVPDLRRLFSEHADLRTRTEAFHERRLGALNEGRFPAPLRTEPSRLVVHVVPAAAFDTAINIDVKEAHARHIHFRPLTGMGMSPRFVAEGFANTLGGERPDAYTLVWRNGIVEAVEADVIRTPPHHGPMVSMPLIETTLVQRIAGYASGLLSLGVAPPLHVAITLQNVAGATFLGRQDRFGFTEGEQVLGPDVTLPIVTLEDPATEAATAEGLRPSLDALWNAGGFAETPSFKTGTWVAPAR